jgi:hypothetical protein
LLFERLADESIPGSPHRVRESEMNAFLLIAAAVLFSIGILHSVVAEWKGERRLVRRITRLTLFDSSDEKDLLAKRIVRLAWHLTSLVWCGCAVVLAYLAFVEATEPTIAVVRILSVVFLLHSALSLAIARGRHSSWLGFLIVSVLAYLGSIGL